MKLIQNKKYQPRNKKVLFFSLRGMSRIGKEIRRLTHFRTDIALAVIEAGVFVAVYTLVLGLPFILATLGKTWLIEFLRANWLVGPLVLMAALATAGPFMYIFFWLFFSLKGQKGSQLCRIEIQFNKEIIMRLDD